MISAYLLNTAWQWQGAGEAWAFSRSVRDVQRCQNRLLRHILRENAETAYGKEFSFASIRNVREYQRQVPIVRHEDLRGYVERVAAGELGVLTAGPVRLLEPTSGSTTAEKWIPYTDTLRRQFQRALSVWVWDVMGRMPGVRRGRAYWSVSPATHRHRVTAGGIRIGFASDSEYLSRGQRQFVSRLLAVPDQIAQLQSTEDFRYATLLYLLACDPLALISIWSPTFLTTLLDDLPSSVDAICRDLHDGRVRLPDSHRGLRPSTLPGEQHVRPASDGGIGETCVSLPLRADPPRARHLSRVFGGGNATIEQLRRCWPGLRLISCWADAASAMYADRLQARFPTVAMQPKGLLATEGIVSFPLVGHPGGVLAIRSHFFEFLEVGNDPNGDVEERAPRLAAELEPHRRYRVLLTTGGGLYRYDLGDEIELVGHYGRCPLIRFVGRSGATSDLVGEKLNEHHVRRVIERICRQRGIKPDFAMLVSVSGEGAPRHDQHGPKMPRKTARQPHYRLYLEGIGVPVDSRQLAQIAAELEVGLSENPHYHLAVQIHQLGPVDVCQLRVQPGTAWQLYEQQCRGRGQKTGDIKPTFLDSWTGWDDLFASHSVS